MVTQHLCLDCRKEQPATVRKIANPGEGSPRCATHLRAFKLKSRKKARAAQVERMYDISAEDNHALLLYQGGKCWICRKATGATKSLAVDHDHADDWVRGRLCGECNQFIGRQLGDDPEAAQRLLEYLSGDTPYRRMLTKRWIRDSYPNIEVTDLSLIVLDDTVRVAFSGGGHNPVWRTTLDNLLSFATPKS